MEVKILEVLRRFESVPYNVIRDQILIRGGNFTLLAERELQLTLEQLQRAGKIVGAGGIFGYWRLAPIGDGNGDRKIRTRRETESCPATICGAPLGVHEQATPLVK